MKRVLQRCCGSCLVGLCAAWLPAVGHADEGGVSFWLPGQFGSFAAVPGMPGWTIPAIYLHNSVSVDADKVLPVGLALTTGLDARVNLAFVAPTYIFETPVAGGQASVGLGFGGGHSSVSITGTVTGPLGNTISGRREDSRSGITDMYPTASLKWNHGVHNTMVYTMADVPVGTYDADRLANLGINHWALDAGAGYTFFNPKTGTEASAVLGFTYNWENPDTDYQNGVDSHLDYAASQMLSPQLQIGMVGYAYYQLTGDSGAGAMLGDFKSRVFGIGPQVGYFFDVGGSKWYFNLKGYYEFEAKNRPEGWNLWMTLAIPLS